jgi:hypothetical protein
MAEQPASKVAAHDAGADSGRTQRTWIAMPLR